jgi:hypothetical protein
VFSYCSPTSSPCSAQHCHRKQPGEQSAKRSFHQLYPCDPHHQEHYSFINLVLAARLGSSSCYIEVPPECHHDLEAEAFAMHHRRT